MNSNSPTLKKAYHDLNNYLFNRLNAKVLKKTFNGQLFVQHGIFKGMRYVDVSNGSTYYPKILGAYERELYPGLDLIVKDQFEHLIVAGTGEGFYAVGINMKCQILKNTFFEIDSNARKNFKKLARINHLTNYNLYDKCTPKSFKEVLVKDLKTFVLMDIEGDELTILNPEVIPDLNECTILVEIHDFKNLSIGKIIFSRFQRSHNIQKILSIQRGTKDIYNYLPFWETIFIRRKYLLQLLDESRPIGMYWYIMKPRC